MPQVWTGKTSYSAYRKIIEHLKTSFSLNYLVHEIPQILSQIFRPKVVIRHDVQRSLDKALHMARIENELGVRAAYMIQADSLFFDIKNAGDRELLHAVRELGHEIGLFFAAGHGGMPLEAAEDMVRSASRRIQNLVSFPILSIAFAPPLAGNSPRSLFLGGKVNASAPGMMRWSISDRESPWEAGAVTPDRQDPEHGLLQVLIHPEDWDENGELGPDV